MRTVDVECIIRAPISDVFEWLTDVSNHRRVPVVQGVRRIRPGDVAEHGTGSVRRIGSPLLRLTEQVVDYVPPSYVRYRITDSFPALARSEGCVIFDAVAEGTRVRWTTRFEVDTSFGGRLLTAVWEPIFSAGIQSVLNTAAAELRARSSVVTGRAGAAH
ncbi:SRPBCC family protein [Nocardia sp. BSTN01]|uniref:SRPBCC family protein n=1 Tax=Nocardia sp. BSTN01 TaxID=2783665 RepID=UPI00188F9ADA|nr:SRPBCC family protein [Nocardia sp. BSTN01]MBF4998075.1 SRPBCC family protein [Nocardia sp. BSTN01]